MGDCGQAARWETGPKAEMRIVTCLILVGIAVTNLYGCRTTYHFENADEVKGKTKITRDTFLQETTVTGPVSDMANKEGRYQLTAKYTNNTFNFYQLIVLQSRTREMGPAWYYQAFDANENKLEVSRFDTFSGTDEKIGIKISKEYLHNSQENGLEVKLFGKRDELLVRVEGFYIKGFLAKAKEAI